MIDAVARGLAAKALGQAQPVNGTAGTRLRLMARAAQSDRLNPLNSPPLTIPAAWALSTAYTVGNIVTNGGNQYLCLIPGTSASSGGPTGTTTAITDGTVTWEYYGVCPITANDPLAPTITQQTGAPGGLVSQVTAASNPSTLRLYGATWTGATVSGSAYQPVSYNQNASTKGLLSFRLAVDTDAPKLAFAFGNSGGYFRLIVDGRYYSLTHLKTLTGSNPNYTIIDFTSVGGRKRRRIEIEGGVGGAVNVNINIVGIFATALDRFWRPPTNDDVRAVWVGDSLGEGSSYGPALAGNTMPARFARLVGITDLWNCSKGGTGYTNKGTSSLYYNYVERLDQVVALNPDIVFFDGSTNDIASGATAVTAAALSALQYLRNNGFTGPIGVFGVWPINDAGVPATETAIQAAVAQFNDPLGKTVFMPMYGDADGPIITGTGKNTGTTGNGNADFYIGGDGLHPIELGAEYNAERHAAAFKRLMLPVLR